MPASSLFEDCSVDHGWCSLGHQPNTGHILINKIHSPKNKEKMKKISSRKLQTALLRGAVTVSGGMATILTALFIEDIYGSIATLMVGGGVITLINSCIK